MAHPSRRAILKSAGAIAAAAALPARLRAAPAARPALFLIGDSTVRNGTQDNGATNGQFGWGRMMKYYFDTARIDVVNDAMGGTSSRSFQVSPQLWGNVRRMIRPGDYVIMAFGHNDSRGSLPGNGDETGPLPPRSRSGANPAADTAPVHTFGWYMREYVRQTRALGATPIILSLIPRNRWTDGRVNRNSRDYALWARQAAEREGAVFIPLHEIITDKYDALGEAKVTAEFFPPGEAVHPNWAGAAFNAACVVEGLKRVTTPLTSYLRPDPRVPTVPDIAPPEIGELGPAAMAPASRTPAPLPRPAKVLP